MVDLKVQTLLGVALFSNLCYFWNIMWILGHSKTEDKQNDSSFARIRTLVLFTSFFQFVTFAASFQKSEKFGG